MHVRITTAFDRTFKCFSVHFDSMSLLLHFFCSQFCKQNVIMVDTGTVLQKSRYNLITKSSTRSSLDHTRSNITRMCKYS